MCSMCTCDGGGGTCRCSREDEQTGSDYLASDVCVCVMCCMRVCVHVRIVL